MASLELNHDIFHQRPEKNGVTQEIKDQIRQQLHLAPKDIFASIESNYLNLTQKQVHYWWTNLMQQQYRRDTDQLISARYLLQESGFTIILHNNDDTSGIKYVGFLTTFFDSLKNNNEIIIDATCKNKHNYYCLYLFAIYYNVLLTLTYNYNCRQNKCTRL